MAVHKRSALDRYATRRLYALLAGWRPARGSAAWKRQTTVTATLNELHPQKRAVLRSGFVIRGRAA